MTTPATSATSHGARTSPWPNGTALLLAVCLSIGAAGLVLAWYGASGSARFRTELIWIAIGVGVCALATVGEAVWLIVGWRRLGRERGIVSGLIRQRRDLRASDAPGTPTSAPVAGFVVGSGMRRRHRAGCDVVRSKPVEPVSAAQSEDLGLLSCGMCGS